MDADGDMPMLSAGYKSQFTQSLMLFVSLLAVYSYSHLQFWFRNSNHTLFYLVANSIRSTIHAPLDAILQLTTSE